MVTGILPCAQRFSPRSLAAFLSIWSTLSICMVVLTVAVFADGHGSIAWAQDADDDDGGDDDGPGPDPGGGDPPSAVGEASGTFSDGDNASTSNADDCFSEFVTRPAWLRECGRPRPPPSARPAAVERPNRPVRVQQAGTGSAAQPRPAVEAVSEPSRTLPREVVLLNVNDQQLLDLEARGFIVIVRSTVFGGTLVRLRVPADTNTRTGLLEARRLAPTAISDFNHIYGIYRPGSGRRQTTGAAWPSYPGGCTVPATVGMIDTPVDPANVALAGQVVEVINVVAAGRQAASPAHGTAIAALISGRLDAAVPGLLTKSRLVAVSAFHKAPDGEDIADTYDLTRAVDTVLAKNIRVINSSFAGPANRILEQAVLFATSKQARIIASTGNAGPGSPPLYPAAYDDVIAVTGVAADERIYRLAIRGQHIDFSGPGVDVQVVSVQAGPRFETGTSFATPFVSAAIAAALARDPAMPIDQAIDTLKRSARDLGAPGPDTVFGWGLILPRNVCP